MEFSEEVFGQRIRKLRQDMGISMENMATSWMLRRIILERLNGE